ncbi:hypothetical protein Tco_1212123 [Tanacetum coccineum]
MSCYVSDYGWLEQSMISQANERMSDEAMILCSCATLMHEREYRTAVCPLLGLQNIMFYLLPQSFVFLLEALSSLEAEGSIWDKFRCVLVIPLRLLAWLVPSFMIIKDPSSGYKIRNIRNGRALQELDEFCREPMIREYVLEFLSIVSFRNHVMDLDVNDMIVFQLGKVTLVDLFYLHSMDGRELVDIPWHVARFLSEEAKGVQKKNKIMGTYLIGRIARHFGLMSTSALRLVTRGQKITLLGVVKLGDLGIVRFNGLRQVEIVDEILDDSDAEAEAVEAKRAQNENEGSPRRHPNMSFTNRLRVMDDRLGEIDHHIYRIGGEVEELTEVVSGLSEQYDQFYATILSPPNHTHFNGTQYAYDPDIPDLGVQQGVNFMSGPQTYSTAPTATPADPFGLFGNPGDVPSTSRQHRSDVDEE